MPVTAAASIGASTTRSLTGTIPTTATARRTGSYIEYLHGQVRELLTNYGKTSMWFFDGLGGKAEDWDALRLIAHDAELEPRPGHQQSRRHPGRYDTPEQRIGMFQNNAPLGDMRHGRPPVGLQARR